MAAGTGSGGAHRALTIGVTGFAEPYNSLPYAITLADALRAELVGLGYACGDPVATEWTSETLGEAVRAAIRSAAATDVLIVHVLSHGEVGETTGKLYVVGADGVRHDLADVESWLAAVQDGADPPLVLFVLDICEAGLAARLPWQGAAAGGTARAWVIAACGPQEQAFNGWLTQATTTVLRRLRAGELDIDPSVEFVPLPKVAQEIRAEVRRLAQAEGDGLRQQVTGTQLDMTVVPPDLPFFRNPAFSSNPLVVLRNREEPALTSFTDGIGEPAAWGGNPVAEAGGPIARVGEGGSPAAWGGSTTGLPDDADLSARHWADRTRGHGLVSAAPDAGCFSGRTAELSDLVPWMQGYQWTRNGWHRTLYVVTGGPGVGKSALLGVLVCAAHPDLRDATRPLWSLASQAPGEIQHLIAVHARQRDLADVTACLARQLDQVLAVRPQRAAPADRTARGYERASTQDATLGAGGVPTEADPAVLVTAVAEATAPVPVPVIVLDALDEAVGSQQIVDELIFPLVGARRADGTPACRLLVGSRRHGFEKLLDAAREQGGLIDLDETNRNTLLHDLAGYVAKLLQTQPGYRDKTRACGAFGYAVATTLTEQPDTDRRWGEFLVAGLYTHSVLRDTAGAPITDVAEADRRGAACPRTLPEVLNLDLAARPNAKELTQVLQIVALARGAGMPATVIDRCRPRRPRFGSWTPTLHALAELGFYLRRTNDEDGTTLYRVFHEGLADHLRPSDDQPEDDEEIFLRAWMSAWEPAWSRRSAEEALVDGMLDGLGSPGARRWDLAEPYVLRHVLDHALAARAVTDDTDAVLRPLLLDPEFLIHADPSMPTALQRLEGGIARLAWRILTDADVGTSADTGTSLAPSGRRRAALALAAVRAGAPALAAALAEPPLGSPEQPLAWRPRWTAKSLKRRFSEPEHGSLEGKRKWWRPWTRSYGLSALTAGVINDEPVVVLGSTSGQIDLRAVADGGRVGGFERASSIMAVGISQGTMIVSVDRAGTLRATDVQTGREIASTSGLSHAVVAVEAATLAGRVTVALTDTDNAITLVDLASGRTLDQIPSEEAAVMLVTADGRAYRLVRRADCTVAVTGPDGEALGVLEGHTSRITTLATMSLDGEPLALTASSDGTVRFWDVHALREVERLPLPGPVQAVVPVGKDHLAVLCRGEAIIYARHHAARGSAA